MKKIALIVIINNPTDAELKAPERLLSAQTASVENIPACRELFVPKTACGESQIFECLRTDYKKTPETPCDSIEGHDAIVYARFSKHKAPCSI